MTAAAFFSAGRALPAITLAPALAVVPADAGDKRALRCRWEYRQSEGRLVQIWESQAA